MQTAFDEWQLVLIEPCSRTSADWRNPRKQEQGRQGRRARGHGDRASSRCGYSRGLKRQGVIGGSGVRGACAFGCAGGHCCQRRGGAGARPAQGGDRFTASNAGRRCCSNASSLPQKSHTQRSGSSGCASLHRKHMLAGPPPLTKCQRAIDMANSLLLDELVAHRWSRLM